jgi:hypothetical protein
MAKTQSDYEQEGRAAALAGQALPFTEAKSWQQKAMWLGYNASQARRAIPAVVEAHIAEMLRRKTPKNAQRVDAKIAVLTARHAS